MEAHIVTDTEHKLSIWSSHIRAKVTTSCNMATPHAPIAILLSHLQALYNIIILTFVIAISLFPGGVAGVAGVTVTLLRLVREVGEGVENVDRREGVGQGGGSITTPK
jgi:hypothetical protein